MDCSNFKNLLDQYIEKDLTKDVFNMMEKHLSSCKECSAELAHLKKYKKEMASLNTLKAPADFLEHVNQRLRKPSFLSRVRDALFIPIKIKLPIEALGVIATVLLIILLVPERIKESIPISKKPEYALRDEVQDIRIAKIKKSELAPKRSISSAKQVEQQIFTQAERKKESFSEEDIKTYEIDLVIKYSAEPYTVANSKIRSKDISSSRLALPEKSLDSNDAEMMYGASGDVKEVNGSAASIKPDAESEKKLKTMDEREYQSKAMDEIKNMVVSMKGRVLEEELSKKDDNLHYIIVEIPEQSIEVFFMRLGRLGTIRSNYTKHIGKDNSGNLRFRIGIIQNK